MKRRPYRVMKVKDVEIEKLGQGREGVGMTFGVDVSKRDLKVMARWETEEYERPWKVENPGEIRELVEKLRLIKKGRELRVAMEPSGTYGDPLRQALTEAGIEVHRVSPKASHDYSEIFDGVPSQFDGKDCGVVAELSANGKSAPWPYVPKTDQEEEMRFRLANKIAHDKVFNSWIGRIEGLLGRYWPESAEYMKPSSSTLLKVLAEYGGPAGVAEAGEEAEKKIAQWGGYFLKKETVWSLVRSARETVGLKQTESTRQWIKEWAEEALLEGRVAEAERKRLEDLTKENETISRMTSVVGVVCACAMWVDLGDPHAYDHPKAYEKAMGLNLKVIESGEYIGKLEVSKRGSSRVRHSLYFAALRMISDPVVGAWYKAKNERSNKEKLIAIVAIMRKLAQASHVVAVKGTNFEASKLFSESEILKSEKGRR